MKQTKKLLSLVMALALALSLVPVGAGAAWSGDGSAENPYQIGTKADLEKFRDIVNGTNGETQNTAACAVLTADIDLDDAAWTPIGSGTYGKSFDGVFDGQGHSITSLYVSITSNEDVYAGLFGGIGDDGIVQNLTLSGTVTGAITEGPTGSISAWAGGVAGRCDGTVTKCLCDVAVTAQGGYFAYAGGVVGYNYGPVTSCGHTGTVTSRSQGSGTYGGGIAGFLSSNSVVENCFNTGDVSVNNTETGTSFVGGIVGKNEGKAITNCYNTGSVTGTPSSNYIGGVVGSNSGTVISCYYLASATVEGGALSESDFKDQTSFPGWDFATVWYMGAAHPELLDLAVPREVGTWSGLQTELQTSGAIRLTDDVKWQSGDLALVVPEGKTVKLDLNGHTVDRGLAGKEAVVDGCVIKVNGSLTLCDSGSGGTITGGNTTTSGGGVDVANEGTFTMRGGKISGNAAKAYGGGVVIRENCKFYMTGGEIRNNKAGSGGGGVDIYKGSFAMTDGTISGNTSTGNGGGVFMYSGTIQMKGAPEISGNKKGEAPNNLYLSSGINITVTGPLDAASRIGVTMLNPRVFTSEFSGKGTAANFTSDDAKYAVGLNADGEALLGNAKVTFHTNDNSEATKEQVIVKGAETTLIANPFTRDGYLFLGWNTEEDGTGTGYTDGQTVTLAGDLDLYAQWRKTPKAIESGADVLRVYANTPDTQVVRFGGLDWYVIAYDGKDGVGNVMQYTPESDETQTPVNLYPTGTVTLLAAATNASGQFNKSYSGNADYVSSDLKKSIDGEGGLLSAFSAEEQAAVKSRTLEGSGGTYNDTIEDPPYDSNKIQGATVENALLWPLSVAEADQMDDDLRNAVAWGPYHSFYHDSWWLRTPGTNTENAAYVASDSGNVNRIGEKVWNGSWNEVHPACYLNLSSILLTSPATGGKPGEVGTLDEIGSYTGNKWKLTVLDNSRAFNVTETTARALPGGGVTLHYTGATVCDETDAPNEYVSALLCDSEGEPISYGKLAQPSSASGTVTVTAPDETGSYTLKLFSEQINGNNVTDYASAFDAVALTVSTDPAPSSGGHTSTYPITLPANVENGAVTVTPQRPAAGQTVTLTAAPDEGYRADAVTVTDKDGKAVALTDNGDGTYAFTMPASPVEVAAVFVPVERPFVDVPKDAWFYEAVYYCYDHDLFKGIDAAHFDPTGTMTRAMFATVLYRMAGEPPVTGENPFTDVENGTWYTDPVIWAASEKIIEGYGDGLFGTNDPVTREQIAAILYRYAQSKGQGFVGSWMFPLDYPDAGEVSAWADEAMHWMVMNGVITGNPDGTLAPKATATRAEVATMLMRFEGLG